MRLKFEELMMTKDWCHLGGKILHDLIIALDLNNVKSMKKKIGI
jgi:hypothetical protein